MFPTTSLATTIMTDRIREAESARRANRTTSPEPGDMRRTRRLRSLATRVATSGLR